MAGAEAINPTPNEVEINSGEHGVFLRLEDCGWDDAEPIRGDSSPFNEWSNGDQAGDIGHTEFNLEVFKDSRVPSPELRVF